MRARLLFWVDGVTVAVEELPGLWRRLVGEPFGEDGWLPAVLVTLGRETYIGTSAVAVACDCPRATAHLNGGLGEAIPVTEKIRLVSLLLTGILNVVRRRYCQDELEWTVMVDDAFCVEDSRALSLACFRSGLAESGLLTLGDMRLGARFSRSAPAAGERVLMAMATSTQNCLRLVGADDSGWHLVDEDHPSGDFSDPCWLVSDPATFRNAWFMQQAIQALLLEASSTDLLTTQYRDGGWVLQDVSAADVRTAEERYWHSIARSCRMYIDSLGGYPVDRVLLLESGLRYFSKRFERTGRAILRRVLGVPVDSVALESWLTGVSATSRVLDCSYGLRLLGERGPLMDYCGFASPGTALPLKKQLTCRLPRGVTGKLHLQVGALDALTSRQYSLGTHEISPSVSLGPGATVSATVRANTPGVFEIRISSAGFVGGERRLLTAGSGCAMLDTDGGCPAENWF